MKSGFLFILGMAAIMALGANGQGELAQIRAATKQFQRLEVAQAAGYNFVSGPNHCNPSFGGAGYQYVNIGLIDTTVDPLHPEALIYVPDSNGALQLGAVEYIVPVTAWNTTHTAEWPRVMGQQFSLDSSLGVYILHVWVWSTNPSGIFENWNPNLACL
jgi:hypothetical protein